MAASRSFSLPCSPSGTQAQEDSGYIVFARGSQLLSVIKFNSTNLPRVPFRHLAQFGVGLVQEA